MPGVHAVWTIDDVRPHLSDILLEVALPSPAYRLTLHRPVLAVAEVVHVGEPIAAVIADDRSSRRRCRRSDRGRLRAIAGGRRLPGGAGGGRAARPSRRAAQYRREFDMGYGDIAAAFAAAPHVFRQSFFQHRGVGQPMECRGTVAVFEPIEERLDVWTSTQTPHAAKRYLCRVARPRRGPPAGRGARRRRRFRAEARLLPGRGDRRARRLALAGARSNGSRIVSNISSRRPRSATRSGTWRSRSIATRAFSACAAG